MRRYLQIFLHGLFHHWDHQYFFMIFPQKLTISPQIFQGFLNYFPTLLFQRFLQEFILVFPLAFITHLGYLLKISYDFFFHRFIQKILQGFLQKLLQRFFSKNFYEDSSRSFSKVSLRDSFQKFSKKFPKNPSDKNFKKSKD